MTFDIQRRLLVMVILSVISVMECNQQLTGREYTIGGRVGEDVVLPCDVNVTSCGRIYFITWTKNASNEWKRVYLYSDSFDKPMGEFFESEKATFFLENNAAYLRIKTLTIEDEGTYKCDVTYVHGKCPSLSFVHLQAYVLPSEPIIEVENEEVVNGSSVGPFSEGSPVGFNCKSFGGRPPPKVVWWNGTESLSSKTRMKSDPNGAFDVIASVRLVLSRWDLGVKLFCRVLTNATQVPQEKWLKLDVHVRPLNLRVRGPRGQVVVGEMVSLTCTVNGARPAANLTWYNRSDIVRAQPSSSKDLMSDGTFRTSSTYVFVASMYDHQGEFFCKGTNEVLKKRQDVPFLKAVRLQVLYPPAVAVFPEGNLSIAEFGSANITCTYDANPPNVTEILWYKDGTIHKPRKRQDTLSNKQSGRLVQPKTLHLQNVTRDDAGLYSCQVRNAFGRGNSSNVLRVNIMYVSTVRLKLDRKTVVEGHNASVSMSCESLSGNPSQLLSVRWFQNGSAFRETEGVTRLSVTGLNRTHTSSYACQGRNLAGWGPVSEQEELLVHYPPGMASIRQTESEAVKGRPVSFRCLLEDPGNPPPSLYAWTHRGRRLANRTEEVLVVDPVTVASQANYSCWAINDVGGGGQGTLYLTAKAPPAVVQGLPTRGGVLRNATGVSLVCRIECDPPCDVTWYRNNESLTESKFFLTSTDVVPEERELNIFRSVLSTLSWSAAQVESYNNSVFSCRSTGNGVGPGVSSSMIFGIEYPPEDVQLSAVKIELVEGGVVEDLKCSASANPGGQFHWLAGQRLVSSGPVLSFNSSISREMGGRYTCVVSNRHGRAEADVDVTVLHRPECFLWRDSDHKGNVVLTCSAKSVPHVTKFQWFRNNTTLQEAVNANGRTSNTFVVSSDSADMFAKYSCVAMNPIGSSEPCELELTPLPSPAGWVQLFLQEENLIIMACVAGGIAVFGIILVTVIVILMIRRRLSGTQTVETEDQEKSPKYGSRRHLEPHLFSAESETEREPFARRICDFHSDLGHLNHLEEQDLVKKPTYIENGVG